MGDADFTFKVIVLGASGVGKTCILQRYCNDVYDENIQKATLSFDYLSKIIRIGDKKVKIDVWDTAGQERYHAMARTYYKDVHGAILVFDTTNRVTFKRMNIWMDDLSKHGNNLEERIIVGSKVDLMEERQVDQYESKKYAVENDIAWTECSAKEAIGIDDIFRILVKRMIDKYNDNPEFRELTPRPTVVYNDDRKKSAKIRKDNLKTTKCC